MYQFHGWLTVQSPPGILLLFLFIRIRLPGGDWLHQQTYLSINHRKGRAMKPNASLLFNYVNLTAQGITSWNVDANMTYYNFPFLWARLVFSRHVTLVVLIWLGRNCVKICDLLDEVGILGRGRKFYWRKFIRIWSINCIPGFFIHKPSTWNIFYQ